MKRWAYLIFFAALILGACSSINLGLPKPEAETEMPVSEMLIATVAALNDVGTMPPAGEGATPTDPNLLPGDIGGGASAGSGNPSQETSLISTGATQLKTAKPLFLIQPGTPTGVPNFVSPEAGCQWAGVGGQVFDQAGTPVKGLIVEVMGMLEGKDILLLAITGSSPTLGPGGYLLSLADHQIQSADNLYIQVYDQMGSPISSQVKFPAKVQCEQNLILINFSQVILDKFFFFPMVPRESNQSFLPNVQGN